MLDLFSMYSSLPLGYNDSVFDESFEQQMRDISKWKVSNCEFQTEQSIEFDQKFSSFGTNKNYKYFHYCCTGSLAIEAAIKTAILYKKHKNPKILCISNSFHGINGYGGFCTSRDSHFSNRVLPFPASHVITVNMEDGSQAIKTAIDNHDITAILVEPIQCSAGDILLDPEYIRKINIICKTHDIPFILDEIQTGFAVTGKLWYFETLQIIPDIVVFGKKTQTSGIMATEKYSEIFVNSYMLEPTWAGDLLDMVRCTYIMKAYDTYNIMDNVSTMSEYVKNNISTNGAFKFQNIGFLMSMHFEDEKTRNIFFTKMLNHGILTNKTSAKTIRLRPNLKLSKADADLFMDKINTIFMEI
jgi:L-lysine 6-transaminase